MPNVQGSPAGLRSQNFQPCQFTSLTTAPLPPLSPGLYSHGCLPQFWSAEEVSCEAEEGWSTQPHPEGVYLFPGTNAATDSLLPCVPEGEGITLVLES